MAFIPGYHIMMAEMRYTVFGQHIENSLYFIAEDAAEWGESQADELITVLGNWFADDIAPLVCTDTVLTEIYLTDLTTDTSPTYSEFHADPGSHSSSSLPLNATWTVTFVTSGRGRSSRGRNYIPSLPENEVTGNEVLVDHANLWIAAYNSMRDAVSDMSNSPNHIVASRYTTDGLEPPHTVPRDEIVWNEVRSYRYADLAVDSQRRRLTGRGN